MDYYYKVSGKGLDKNYKAVDWMHEGLCNDNHPYQINGTLRFNEDSNLSFAVLNAVRDCIDVLDHCTGSLAPQVSVERKYDGSFDAVVDTNGLGDITVRLIHIPKDSDILRRIALEKAK